MNVLDEIFANKRLEVERRVQLMPLEALQMQIEQVDPPLDFIGALRRPGEGGPPALIAEVKCASPSRGLLAPGFDPSRLARTYAENGAAAISVLTDERYFKGHLDHLRQVVVEVKGPQPPSRPLPLLRKDFIYDPYQVYEARCAGADAILLIVAALDPEQLAQLQGLARQLGMEALVEVHNRAELDLALACDPRLVGINNRDLKDFSVDLETTLRLRPSIPDGVCVVSESGIRTPEDLHRLASAGVDAILVGEALVTAPDVAEKVRSFTRLEPSRL